MLTFGGLFVGLGLLLVSTYLYLFTGKIVFSSESMKINAPETSVLKQIALKETDNPYQILLHVNYQVVKEASKHEEILFSYRTTLRNGKNEVIEHKSSSYNYYVQKEREKNKKVIGNKSDTITLFTLKDLPTDTYSLSIEISPTEEANSPIILDSFSYAIRKNILSLSPIVPLVGILITGVSYLFLSLSKKHHAATNHETKPAE